MLAVVVLFVSIGLGVASAALGALLANDPSEFHFVSHLIATSFVSGICFGYVVTTMEK